METNIDTAKMAQVSKIITEKQDDPWDGERPGQDAKKSGKKKIITYRRISKRLAVETTSLLLFIFYYSIPSLLKSKHAISITCAEMHASHIVSSGSLHNVLHFSSNKEGGRVSYSSIELCTAVVRVEARSMIFAMCGVIYGVIVGSRIHCTCSHATRACHQLEVV